MVQTGDLALYEGKPYGNIMFRSDYAGLIRLGFQPGDSVDVHFSGGAVLEDIPFLSGCILPEGIICVNAHEGFDWIRGEKRFGNIWDQSGIREGETAKIILRESRKYTFLYQIFNLEFTLERDDHPGDECFTNYRELSCGHLRKRMFYRSVASFDPDNRGPEFRKRQEILDRLIERDGIQSIVNMDCNRQQMEKLFASGEYNLFYVQKLYNEGNIFSDQFSIDYSGSVYRKQVTTLLRNLPKQTGPYLIQCKAGLDRTGFLCALLEALVGADLTEVIDDYMRSYDSLFGLTRENDREKYDILRRYQADRIIKIITLDNGSETPRFASEVETATEKATDAIDLCAAAEKYLQRCGLDDAEIAGLKDFLTE